MKRILRTLKRKLRVAMSLSWQDWNDLALAWVMLWSVDIGLRTLPFLKLQRLLERTSRVKRGGYPQIEIPRLDRLVWIVSRYHLYEMTCLRQALVLKWLLGRNGFVSELKIGVAKDLGAINAHAWLEFKDESIQSKAFNERFKPLLQLVDNQA